MSDPPASLPPVRLPGGRVVPEHALRERAGTSGGPGGQHANRSATGIELSVLVWSLPLDEHERELLTARLGGRLTADGWLTVRAADERHQLRNRRRARERLERLLRDALRVQRRRRPTRVPRAVNEARLDRKRRRASVKRQRAWRPAPTTDGS